jgi:hypothetical protein
MTPQVRYDTTGAIWHRWCRGPRILEALSLPLKGISIKKYIGKFYYPIAIKIIQKMYGLYKDHFSKPNILANSKSYATKL